jgi:hypothetical protein
MSKNEISTPQNKKIMDNENFKEKMLRLNVIACKLVPGDAFDLKQDMRESMEGLNALKACGGLQEMLAAQMLSIHHMQQLSMGIANGMMNTNSQQYFTNIAIKLANTFIQQANLLARLQGNGSSNVSVGHVEVHDGGQAVVGNINHNITPKEKNENDLL